MNVDWFCGFVFFDVICVLYMMMMCDDGLCCDVCVGDDVCECGVGECVCVWCD